MEVKGKSMILAAGLVLFTGAWMLGADPRWVYAREEEYPDSRFISAQGIGPSTTQAEQHAMNGLSLYFKSTVAVQQELISQYNEVVSGGEKFANSGTTMRTASVIRSEAEFRGARFTSPWYNDKTRNWHVLAYIDKEEAQQIYENRIAHNKTWIDSLLAGELEPLQRYQRFKGASLIARMIEEDIRALGELSTTVPRHGDILKYTQNIVAEGKAFRSRLRFTAALEEDRQNRIQRKLLDILEQHGYVAVRNQGDYTITGKLSFEEETLPVGTFIHSGITLQLVNTAGDVLFSYTKSYPRLGSRNVAMAYNIAVREMEKDLEENFITEFNAFIGD
ncbi:MAG: hypothetical protein LBQ30_08315 [Treponema sp.]|jgi:hypothetical protein|nr:hypothetical protein [Treponema sp.]